MSQKLNTSPIDPVVTGENVIIKPFTVIGMTGFGFETKKNGKYKIPLKRKKHPYKVIIGDNVEIGVGCVIDRGSWRDSVIGEGTKIDNMVHTGHNSVIGKNCLLAVGVTLGGSTTIGDNCFLGMNSMTKQGVSICDNVTIGMGAVVTKDITEPFTTWVGNPARRLPSKEEKEKAKKADAKRWEEISKRHEQNSKLLSKAMGLVYDKEKKFVSIP